MLPLRVTTGDVSPLKSHTQPKFTLPSASTKMSSVTCDRRPTLSSSCTSCSQLHCLAPHITHNHYIHRYLHLELIHIRNLCPGVHKCTNAFQVPRLLQTSDKFSRDLNEYLDSFVCRNISAPPRWPWRGWAREASWGCSARRSPQSSHPAAPTHGKAQAL